MSTKKPHTIEQQREIERKRFDIEHRKEQEVLERKKQELLERSRREHEQKQSKEKEDQKRRLEEQRLKKEREEDRIKEKENQSKSRDEEEKKKRVELELRKKLDDDSKRADERKKKMEEMRKKRMEDDKRQAEDRRRVQEAELQRLEQLNADMLNNIANNDYSFLTSANNNEFQVKTNTEPKPLEIDLLEGGSEVQSDAESDVSDVFNFFNDDDEDWVAKKPKAVKKYVERPQTVQNQAGNLNSSHRLAPQRGKIDELTDNYLDDVVVQLPIKKQGKKDGVYIFGQRMMRTQIDLISKKPLVIIGNSTLSVEDFIQKFENTEIKRKKGLESALIVTRMMGNSINPTIPSF